jgi:hypothetical protein
MEAESEKRIDRWYCISKLDSVYIGSNRDVDTYILIPWNGSKKNIEKTEAA